MFLSEKIEVQDILYTQFCVFVYFTKPGNNSLGRLVDILHHGDLNAFLFKVRLVNTDRINPKPASIPPLLVYAIPRHLHPAFCFEQERLEIFGNQQRFPLQFNLLRTPFSTPRVGQGRKVWGPVKAKGFAVQSDTLRTPRLDLYKPDIALRKASYLNSSVVIFSNLYFGSKSQ